MGRKPITWTLPSSRSRIGYPQARLFALLIAELREEQRHLQGQLLEETKAYYRFIEAGAACGFVCRDIEPLGEYLEYLTNLDAVSSASFMAVRRFMHTLIRHEQHQGSGYVRQALDSGVLSEIARRLEEDADWLE